jgi:hypothetical protein
VLRSVGEVMADQRAAEPQVDDDNGAKHTDADATHARAHFFAG